jgi:hypothetical protein
MKKFWFLYIFILSANIAFPQNAWINEFHYDNVGTDVGEFVEIVIENPGSYNLSDFQVDLYNGSNGTSYGSETVDNFTVGSTVGNFTFYYWEVVIQNGSPDGFALSYLGSVIIGQFLSYEGPLTATDGPANGLTSTDVLVFEDGTTPVGYSLQLGGTGTQYSDFTWNAPAPETKGFINNGQSFGSGTISTINVTPSVLSGFSYVEGLGPSSEQSFDISGSDLTDDISITPPIDYEISTGTGGSFVPTDPIVLTQTGGTVSSTTIYVRLKEGLTLGEYNGENITATSTGADDRTVTCNGSVVKAEPTNHVTSFTGVLGNPPYYYDNLSWTDATGGTVPDGYLIKRSSVDFTSITDPIDGVPESDPFSVMNVAQGIQSALFTGFADTTYYFKIYPYTNSGPYINYKTDGSVPQFSLTNASAPTLPVTENFEYATGSNLTDNGWVAHSGGITNPIQVNDTALTYSGYLNSGLGKSVSMTTSGQDVNRAFHTVLNGSIYASFMVNIDSAKPAGDYFFHLGLENTTSLFYAKVFVKMNENDSLAFGIAKRNNSDVVYTPFDYIIGETYLIVVKYTFNDVTTTDDTVKLWINPVLDGTEPPSDLTQGDGGDDALSLGMFALRQGSSSTAAALVLGGIRISDTWVPESGGTTFSYSIDVYPNKWNMVSAPGINPAGMGVGDWWPNYTGNVWSFNGTVYVNETPNPTTPGKGYWMKHNGTNTTYDYTDIGIVSHDPIPGHTNWNIIGVYENNVVTSGITTDPGGQRTGTVWGFNGTVYVNMSSGTLEPGYGYWIKLLSTCDIIIPEPPLAKSSGEVADYFKEDWGRITMTDAAGISYTLYAVKGEVDLDQYEMPPMPPAGSFDIRYSSGRVAEDINSSVQTIDMSGITYPLTVRVENMDIRLQDVTGKAINVNLKSGEDIVISDATINKLMVSGELIPTVYALEQNYPNPFNPSTVIEFSLPENVSNVKLSIYNVLGEKVAELVNTALDAGRYSYQWNAGNVATGMYIYELRTDKFVSVKKMMLLK